MVIKSSGLKTDDALIFTGPCHLIGVSYTGTIAKISTLTIYDYLSAGGVAVAFLRASSVTTDTANPTVNLMFPGKGLPCSIGIHAEMSAAEGSYIIYYSL